MWYKNRHNCFQQTTLMEIIDTTDVRKEKLNSYSLVPVEHNSVKSDYKLFGVPKKSIRSENIKGKK